MENKREFLKDLGDLIACKSVLGEAAEGAPFGRETRRALDIFLAIAARMGFETKNYDGYIGEVTWGEGEEFGIIGHLDVVPEGAGWNSDPYLLTERGGRYYGRGVIDDKGPILICLYALNAVKQSGIIPRRKFRLFVGCNEESGWGDVDHFTAHGGKFPEWGFSPDGNFPVVYAEKGPNAVTFHFPYKGRFTKIAGGSVVNAVCAYAEAVGPIDEALLADHGLTHDGAVIKSFGKAAHGSLPELGKNAIKPLLEYMCDLGEPVGALKEYLFDDKLGLTKIGNETGRATLSPDIISQTESEIAVVADFRVPARMKAEEFYKIFDAMGIKYELEKKRDPQYVPKESPMIKTLLAAYDQATGEHAEAASQCGATFASVFKSGAAFGPEFEGRITQIHEADENMLIDEPDKLYAIYYGAIKAIAEGKA